MPLARKKPLQRKAPLKTGGSLAVKKAKGKTTAWFKEQAVMMAKFIVKKRTPYCERCKSLNRPFEEWCTVLNGSHVYSVGAHPDMAAELENIKTLGYRCHIYWWHRETADAWDWFCSTWPERANRLRERAQRVEKVDWRAKYYELYDLAVQYGWNKPRAV